jgi:dipeptidase
LVNIGQELYGLEEKSCTAIIVGKDASVDGSVMTTHTCDGWYDSRLFIIPGGKHEPGETVKVYKNRLNADNPNVVVEVVGEIPQVAETYTYFHIAYPFMNEHQVAIGESTFGGRPELVNPNGMFYIEELEAIALQRAKTAREAIRIMGELAEKYGYADWGECLTVVDPNEGWVFEIVGPGPLWAPDSGKPGAVWVARRVPDDEVFVSANRSRIGEIDLSKPDWYMASPNVYTLAQEMGWYDPNAGKPFRFCDVYAPKESFYNSRREWRVFDLVAPSRHFDPYARWYPFSVKPDRKLSVADLMAINRDYYEGTEFDLTKGMAAGPFGTPDRYATPSKAGANWERAISMFRCSYSFVSQSRNWLPDPIGGVLWFGLDAPHATCYMPLYCGITKVPESLQVMNRFDFSRESAWWAFDFVENWANLAFCYMIQDIKAMQQKFEGEFFAVQPAIEQAALTLYQRDPDLARTFLTNYCNDVVNRVVEAWWKFADELVAKYNDGYIWQKMKGYPDWWLQAVGYTATTRLDLYKDIRYEDENK